MGPMPVRTPKSLPAEAAAARAKQLPERAATSADPIPASGGTTPQMEICCSRHPHSVQAETSGCNHPARGGSVDLANAVEPVLPIVAVPAG